MVAGSVLLLAQPAHETRTGPLEVVIEDWDDHAVTRHLVQGQQIKLQDADAKRLQPGQHVRVRGPRKGQVLEVEEVTVTRAVPGTAGARGEQPTLVMVVAFRDGTKPPPSAATWRAWFAPDSDFNAFIRQQSDGVTWFTSTVVDPPLVVGMSASQSCDYWLLASQADAAARARGYDLSRYARLVYSWSGPDCGWKGMSTMTGTVGNPSRTWTPPNKAPHELGHALGLHHASSAECGTEVRCDQPQVIEYALCTDRMGAGGGSFSPAHLEVLGWRTDEVVTVTAPGRWTLTPLASASGVRGLRVPRTASEAYYVEYRGPDEPGLGAVPGCEALGRGALIRTRVSQSRQTLWLDLTPHVGGGTKYGEWVDAYLPVGQTYWDAALGLGIRADVVTPEGLVVSVVTDDTPPPTVELPLVVGASVTDPVSQRTLVVHEVKGGSVVVEIK